MASFEKRGNSVRAIVFFQDGKKTKTFSTLREAKQWAALMEHEKDTGQIRSAQRRIAEDVFMAYLPVAEATDSAKWNRLRLLKFCTDPISKVSLEEISPVDIENWIRRRMIHVGSATVRRELALLSSAFTYAIKVCKWLKENPCHGVQKPAKGRPRKRDLLTPEEIAAISAATGYDPTRPPSTLIARTGACFFLAMETAMRSGEILRIRPKDYNREARTVYVHALERGGRKGTRSGERRADRYVPLTQRAMEILDQLLATMPEDQSPQPDMTMPPYIVGLTDRQRDVLWRKARDRSGVEDLTFHDMKHEAATRLAGFIDVIALSHAIGTKDLKLLRDTYYNNDAQRIAAKLPASLSEVAHKAPSVPDKPRRATPIGVGRLLLKRPRNSKTVKKMTNRLGDSIST